MAFQACTQVFAAILATGIFSTVASSTFAAAENPAAESPDVSASAPIAYELGQGLRLGESGFTVGGYSAVQYQNTPKPEAGASLTHLSMFLWWENQARLKFFSELDRESETVVDGNGAVTGEAHYLAVERAYFDYTYSDLLTVRAGKFLTPVGRWNAIHADPLVWTTSRPDVTNEIFPDNATGLMVHGNFPMLGRQADYALYVASRHDLRTEFGKDPFARAYGGRLSLPANENLQLGLSYLSFTQRAKPEEQKALLGLDFLWAYRGYELSGEAAYRTSNEGARRDVKGGFIQGVVPLSEKIYAVGRIETLRQPRFDNTARLWLLGINYRASRAISLKVEFIHGVNTEAAKPVGFLSSVSVLF